MNPRTLAIAIVTLLVTGIIAYQAGQTDAPASEAATPAILVEKFQPALFDPPTSIRIGYLRVVRVVDGDTVRVMRGGKEVPLRLIGVDTPELQGRGKALNQPGSVEAARWLESVLKQDPQLRPEYDVERTDKYNRLLAYAWIRYRGEGEERLLNEEIIRAGHGRPRRYPPNTKYAQRFDAVAKSDRMALR